MYDTISEHSRRRILEKMAGQRQQQFEAAVEHIIEFAKTPLEIEK